MEVKKKHFNIKKAVILSILAALSFSIMAFFAKIASSYTNTNMLILFRFGISFLYVLIILGIKKLQNKKLSLKTNHLPLHIFRSIISMTSMFLFYFSLKYIPLVDGNLLVMTNSLFISILGAIFLHHKISKKHWMAVILGFIGIIFILKPGHELFNPMSILALLAGISIAMGLLSLRTLSKHDNHYVCMFYYFSIVFAISSLISIFYWEKPDLYTIVLLVVVAVFAIFFQEFLIRASSQAPAKITSALLYTSLIFSAFFSWFFFKDIPDLVTLSGIIIVCFSSVLIIRYAKK